MNSRFMRLSDFATHVNKAKSTVYYWKTKGWLPVLEVNGVCVVDMDAYAVNQQEDNVMASNQRKVSIIKKTYTTRKGEKKEYEYKQVRIGKSCPTFYEYAKRVIDGKRDIKSRTKMELMDTLEKYIRPSYEFVLADEVTRDMLAKTINDAPAKHERIKQIITETCAELAWNDYIPKDISAGLKLPKYDKDGNKIKRREPKELPTWDDLMKFYGYISGCNKPLAYVVMFMFCAGTNRSETLALRKEDFNLEECYVKVNKAYSIGGDKRPHITEPKNKYRVRKVYFPRSILPILKKGMDNDSDWFAPDRTEKKPIDPKNFANRYFFSVGKKLKLSKSIGTHVARHVYITNAIDNGVPPTEVMRQVGHRDLRMIMSVYTHYIQRDKPSESMRQHMEDMAAAVTGQQKKPTSDDNLIRVDFSRRFA